jgi:hypothetical protein
VRQRKKEVEKRVEHGVLVGGGGGDNQGLIASSCEDNKKNNETWARSFSTNDSCCSNYDYESMTYELNDMNFYLLTFFFSDV